MRRFLLIPIALLLLAAAPAPGPSGVIKVQALHPLEVTGVRAPVVKLESCPVDQNYVSTGAGWECRTAAAAMPACTGQGEVLSWSTNAMGWVCTDMWLGNITVQGSLEVRDTLSISRLQDKGAGLVIEVQPKALNATSVGSDITVTAGRGSSSTTATGSNGGNLMLEAGAGGQGNEIISGGNGGMAALKGGEGGFQGGDVALVGGTGELGGNVLLVPGWGPSGTNHGTVAIGTDIGVGRAGEVLVDADRIETKNTVTSTVAPGTSAFTVEPGAKICLDGEACTKFVDNTTAFGAPANTVTTDTAQDISGAKTFTSPLKASTFTMGDNSTWTSGSLGPVYTRSTHALLTLNGIGAGTNLVGFSYGDGTNPIGSLYSVLNSPTWGGSLLLDFTSGTQDAGFYLRSTPNDNSKIRFAIKGNGNTMIGDLGDAANAVTEKLVVKDGNLKLWGTPGTHGLIFPDGTKQTTAGGGGTPANVVTTDSTQTITGAKTFSNTLSLSNTVAAEKFLVYDGPGARYGFGISDFTLRAFTPGASGLEYFNVYYGGTSGGFPALSLETKNGDLSVTGKFAAGGDSTLSAIGSSYAIPRSFGIIDIGAPGRAARWFMGDAANGIQLAYGQKLQMYAYHGIEISGGRGGGQPDFVPGNGASDASLKVIGNAEVTGALVVPGGASISGSGVGSYSGGPEIHFKTDADHGMARFFPLTGTGKDRFYAYYDSADITNSSQFHTALVKSTGWYTNSPGAYIASTKGGSGVAQNLYLVANDYEPSGLMDPARGLTLLANTGRVGIGTITPEAYLHVKGVNYWSSGAPLLKFQNSESPNGLFELTSGTNLAGWFSPLLRGKAGGGGAGLYLVGEPEGPAGDDGTYPAIILDGRRNGLALASTSPVLSIRTLGTEVMKVTAGGNVGIGTGTDALTEKLEVAGNVKVSGSLQLGASSDTCDSTNRRKMRYVEGAAGVADRTEICMKKADDTYAWVASTTAP